MRVFRPGRLSVPNGCACGEFAVSQIRTQFVRLAKDTAIMGLLVNCGVEECLPNGERSLPRSVAQFSAEQQRMAKPPVLRRIQQAI